MNQMGESVDKLVGVPMKVVGFGAGAVAVVITAPIIIPAIKVANPAVANKYFRNAPQINQGIETVVRDVFDASGPSFYSGVKENLPGGSQPGIWNQ